MNIRKITRKYEVRIGIFREVPTLEYIAQIRSSYGRKSYVQNVLPTFGTPEAHLISAILYYKCPLIPDQMLQIALHIFLHD